jgi:hypothetical protein
MLKAMGFRVVSTSAFETSDDSQFAAAIGESWYGAARPLSSFFYVYVVSELAVASLSMAGRTMDFGEAPERWAIS